MIECSKFYDTLLEHDINFITGVPDSLLKEICAYLAECSPNHVIAANEGAAVGLAMGHYLATGTPGVVYLQNSGFGNMVNPVLSLADEEVYGIPMLFLIGWRGQPGVKDEPQHKKQGRVTESLLKAMEMPYEILGKDINTARGAISRADAHMREKKSPFVLLIEKDTFEKHTGIGSTAVDLSMTREQAIRELVRAFDQNDIVVSTTGKTSRELFELRAELGHGHNKDFLTIGAMGHASQIALGIALQKRERNVICLDGDGAAIMHMGSLAVIANSGAENFMHIVINNGAHDSVGGQPTAGFDIDFCQIATACGYHQATSVSEQSALKSALITGLETKGPNFLEIKVRKGARE